MTELEQTTGENSQQGTVTYEGLDRTEDTGDPVMRVRVRGTPSKMDVILGREHRTINVWHVKSDRTGDMKRMLNGVVSQLGWTSVCFLSPLDDLKADHQTQLKDRLDGFKPTTETIELPDGTVEEQLRYVGEWTIDD